MSRTCGIHVIWTTYGSWLPGDPRGHWSGLFDLYGRVDRHTRHQLNSCDKTTLRRAKSLLKEPSKTLSNDEIQMVAHVIADHIAPGFTTNQITPGMPGAIWGVYALAIEPIHVHLLLSPMNETLSVLVGKIKSQSASALLKLPSNQGRTQIWTAKYWKVFLFDGESVHIVRKYIESHNIRNGLPVRPWSWIMDVPD